jgi:hypothetical protein
VGERGTKDAEVQGSIPRWPMIFFPPQNSFILCSIACIQLLLFAVVLCDLELYGNSVCKKKGSARLPKMSAPTSIPSCAVGKPGLQTTGGFAVCSGTSGGKVPGTAPAVANTEMVESRTYHNFYNSTKSAPGAYNACITQGVPTSDDLKRADTKGSSSSGAEQPAWNVVGYMTAQGCCSLPDNWGKDGVPAAASNQSRATRLTPFSTASAPGAKDSANIDKGVPRDITGMTKLWGSSPKNWSHGGVQFGNVGVWHGDPMRKSPTFTIRTQSQGTWRQKSVLWCRLTGDNYQAKDDPLGVSNPAPAGGYLDKQSVQVADACKACGAEPASGQILLPTSGGACANPYTQVLDQAVMTETQVQTADGSPAPIVALKDPDPTTAASTPGYPYATTVNPWTNDANGYNNIQGRVGGVFVTQDMYGPGTFTVLINLPPTAPPTGDACAQDEYPMVDPFTGIYPSDKPTAVRGGRGYVFSIWTFNESEAYNSPDGPSPFNSTTGSTNTLSGSDTPPVVQVPVEGVARTIDAADPLLTNPTVAVPYIDGIQNKDDGTYAVHNHEIDIEVPANTGQIAQGQAQANQYLGLNTANLNTWLADRDEYDPGTSTLYQQTQVTAPEGEFFASVGSSDTDETYIELTFVWYVAPEDIVVPVDPTVPTKSYVAFYRNGVEMYRSYRFIPRRSGRVNVGLWPAWWGSQFRPLNFNQVYAKIARMDFVPQCDYTGKPFEGGALVTNGAQQYDQVFPVPAANGALSINSGISSTFPITSSSHTPHHHAAIHLPKWAVAIIVLGVLGLVAAGIACLYIYYLKPRAARLRQLRGEPEKPVTARQRTRPEPYAPTSAPQAEAASLTGVGADAGPAIGSPLPNNPFVRSSSAKTDSIQQPAIDANFLKNIVNMSK